jgi:serine/threonine protein kinase
LNDFQELKVIGVGSFGKVTKCKNRIDGLNYAIKQTKREYGGDKDLYVYLEEGNPLTSNQTKLVTRSTCTLYTS